MRTYAVSFGDAVTARGEMYLSNAVKDRSEDYINVNSADQLKAALERMMQTVLKNNRFPPQRSYSVTSPALPSYQNKAVQAVTSFLNTADWTSELRFYDFLSDGVTLDLSKYTTPSINNAQRKVLINTGAQTNAMTTRNDNYSNNSYFGLPLSNTNEWTNTLLPWVSRLFFATDEAIQQEVTLKDYRGEDPTKVKKYRMRSLDANGVRPMGDILDSPVLVVGETDIGNRNKYMVTAANDGLVYLFKASTNATHPYDLKLNYMPSAMERSSASDTVATILNELRHPQYGTKEEYPHRYLTNGGMVLRQTSSGVSGNRPQQSFMVGAMGQGGRGIYALNVGGKKVADATVNVGMDAAETAFTEQVPLFETPKGASNTMGYTVGAPQVGMISLDRENGAIKQYNTKIRYAAFAGSGYSRTGSPVPVPEDETALYIYDALGQDVGMTPEAAGTASGTLLAKIVVPGGVGGLSAPTLVDTDFDQVIDVVYAGDRGGNMYRFDLRAGDPGVNVSPSWKVTRIFQGSSEQPITSAPAVSRTANNKYTVIFGTGSDIYQRDLTDESTQAVYGIFDTLPATPATAHNTGGGAVQSDLLEQTLSTKTVNDKVMSELTNNPILTTHKGWFFNLSSKGQRVVTKPDMSLRTAFVTTRSYATNVTSQGTDPNDPCLKSTKTEAVQAESARLQINSRNGGQLSTRDAYLQWTSDGIIYSGITLPGLTSFAIIDSTAFIGTLSRDGDGGGSGTDAPMTGGSQAAPKNTCFANKNIRRAMIPLGSQSGFGDTWDIMGGECSLIVKRLSWREIF